jgi:hypothetical protein
MVAALPENVGCETEPSGVPLTDTLSSLPVKVGAVALYAASPVLTVLFVVENVSVSLDTDTDRMPRDSVAPAEATLMVGAETLPVALCVPVNVVLEPVNDGCDTLPVGV